MRIQYHSTPHVDGHHADLVDPTMYDVTQKRRCWMKRSQRDEATSKMKECIWPDEMLMQGMMRDKD